MFNPKTTRFSRRQAVWGGLAGVSGGLLGCSEHGDDREPRELWISAAGNGPDKYAVAFATTNGEVVQIETGVRGHDVVSHPLRPGRVLLVGRRPGTQMVEVDLHERRVSATISTKTGNYLGGHAVFDGERGVLFSAEMIEETGEGRLVVRDASDYRVLDEYPSHGIGPHQLLVMPDGQRLAVANGGLLTRPESGSTVLNLGTMRSALAFVDIGSGELQDEWTVQEDKASLRHLDVTPDGVLVVALQMQRDAVEHEEPAPLAAVHREGEGLVVLEAPEELLWGMNDYVGSTKVDAASRHAAFTSPRGDLVLFWDVDTGEFVGHHSFVDVSGVAVSRSQDVFVLSSSSGLLRALDTTTFTESFLPDLSSKDVAWDNHMNSVALSD